MLWRSSLSLYRRCLVSETQVPLAAPVAPAAGRAQLALLLAASCLPVLGATLLAPVLPQVKDAFAGTPGVEVLTPLMLSAPALLVGLTAPFAGFVADRIDRRRTLLIAMVGYSVVGTAPLYLPGLPAIVVSRVLLGLCEAAIMTCCTTMIGDYWSGPRRARYMGLQTLTTAIAATVFLGAGGALGGAGWRTPFWLYLAAALLAVPMARLLWEPARSAARSAKLVALPWRQLATPCLVTLFGGILFYTLIVELSFVLDDAGVGSTAAIGGISALMSLATAVGAGLFGRLSGSTAARLVPIEFGCAAVGLGIVAATHTVAVIIAGAIVTGFGTGLMLPTLLVWAVNRLTFDQRGRGTGLWTGTLFLGQFASALVVAGLHSVNLVGRRAPADWRPVSAYWP